MSEALTLTRIHIMSDLPKELPQAWSKAWNFSTGCPTGAVAPSTVNFLVNVNEACHGELYPSEGRGVQKYDKQAPLGVVIRTTACHLAWKVRESTFQQPRSQESSRATRTSCWSPVAAGRSGAVAALCSSGLLELESWSSRAEIITNRPHHAID